MSNESTQIHAPLALSLFAPVTSIVRVEPVAPVSALDASRPTLPLVQEPRDRKRNHLMASPSSALSRLTIGVGSPVANVEAPPQRCTYAPTV